MNSNSSSVISGNLNAIRGVKSERLGAVHSGGFKENGPGGTRSGAPGIQYKIANKFTRVWFDNYGKQKEL